MTKVDVQKSDTSEYETIKMSSGQLSMVGHKDQNTRARKIRFFLKAVYYVD